MMRGGLAFRVRNRDAGVITAGRFKKMLRKRLAIGAMAQLEVQYEELMQQKRQLDIAIVSKRLVTHAQVLLRLKNALQQVPPASQQVSSTSQQASLDSQQALPVLQRVQFSPAQIQLALAQPQSATVQSARSAEAKHGNQRKAEDPVHFPSVFRSAQAPIVQGQPAFEQSQPTSVQSARSTEARPGKRNKHEDPVRFPSVVPPAQTKQTPKPKAKNRYTLNGSTPQVKAAQSSSARKDLKPPFQISYC